MQDYPHHYSVSASGQATGTIRVECAGLESIDTAPPAEFGGPGDLWSPETLLAAAVADCFILTFRAIARASTFEWNDLKCEVVGVLDHAGRESLFTQFKLSVELTVATGTDEAKAVRLLEKSEQRCLITNSLKSELSLETTILFA